MLNISRRALLIAAFDGTEIKLADTPVKDGKIVYLIGGKEELVDPTEVFTGRSRITALNGEAQGHRTKAETALADLKKYDGIDPAKAREAFDTLSKIDQKKLIDSGQVEVVRGEIKAVFQAQLDEAVAQTTTLKQQIANMRLDSAFSGSKFVKDDLAIPADIAQATFSKYFTVGDDGKITAKDSSGNVVWSRDPQKSGVAAEFEEAIKILVDGYSNKNAILKGNTNSGAGNNGGGGNNGGSGKTKTRAEFEKLSPADAAAYAKEINAGTAKLVG